MTSSDSVSRDFASFGLDERIQHAIQHLGFEKATPIQAQAIPVLLDGRDLIGQARTGSGKTAAFGLPVLEKLKDGGKHVRALLLTPTRELAIQVTDALRKYAARLPVDILCIYGGSPYERQLRALRAGVTIVVGTPGRILDHIGRKTLKLDALEFLVLDEADEMLRMGFIDDVQAIFDASPESKQVTCFSATMPDPIRRLAQRYLRDPEELQVEAQALSTDHIAQRWMRVPQQNKLEALERVLSASPTGAILVFARTRRGCGEVADALAKRGFEIDALHGDLNQSARERVLSRLRAGRLRIVVATDVAARGIDVDHLTQVVNLDLPHEKETYVHRIGRTGRGGREGRALSFVTPGEERRVKFWQRSLGVTFESVPAPSDAVIAEQRQGHLREEISTTSIKDAEALQAFAQQMMEAQEWTAEELAQAAIQALAQRASIRIGGNPNAEPPAWSVQRVRKKRSKDANQRRNTQGGAEGMPFSARNEVEVFLPIGRSKGVRPGDLVGALANELGIPSSNIGKVTVEVRKSFVGLPRDVAETLLANHNDVAIRGKKVPIKLGRPRSERPDTRPGPNSHRKNRPASGRRPKRRVKKPFRQHRGG